MKIKTKLPLFTSVTVLFSIVAIALYSIVDFRKKTIESIASYKEEQIEIIKEQLKDNVDNAHAMLKQAHELAIASMDPEDFDSGDMTQVISMSQFLFLTKENIRKMRFGADGYIWLNENDPPYTVIMHPTKPDLEGKPGNYIIKSTQKDVYEAFAETIKDGGGEGFLQYDYYKPANNERIPKLSYIKLYEPLNWVVGTGVYIDHIDKMVARKTQELDSQINKIIFYIIIFGIGLLALASVSLYFLGKTITDAIYKVREQLFDMSLGRIVAKSTKERKDEIGDMTNSLHALIDGVNSYSNFALSIGEGNLDADFSLLSEEDELGNSLIKMRKSLQKAREEEEVRTKENEKRNWANEGFTKFSEIMRVNRENINEMAYSIISNLVRYVSANQGGLFLYNDDDIDDIYLEQAASIAYNRRKYIEKKIRPGDGMVGACALEKKRIYMTNIPKDYIEIRSGLGTANPACVLIVPLLMENNLIGIIEIASFEKLYDYQVEFIEQVSDNIAASLYAARINTQTNRLMRDFKTFENEKNELNDIITAKNKEIEELNLKIKKYQSEKSVFQFN